MTLRDRETTYKEASEADERYKNDKSKGPLDGIPLAIKDNLLVKGIQSSAVSKSLKDFVAPIDSTSVSRLRK